MTDDQADRMVAFRDATERTDLRPAQAKILETRLIDLITFTRQFSDNGGTAIELLEAAIEVLKGEIKDIENPIT